MQDRVRSAANARLAASLDAPSNDVVYGVVAPMEIRKKEGHMGHMGKVAKRQGA